MEDENCVTEVPTTTINTSANEQSTHLMPMLYIQQAKLRAGPSANPSQTIVPSNATQLATIINPVNNQIITGQNKVFIQGSNPVTTNQNKHIVIHRPVNTTVSAVTQNQKHILVRKPKTTSAQILPLSASQGSQTHAQSGKHTFTYLGTLIKPSKVPPVVIPRGGTLTTTPINKSKVVIAPVISQLAQTSSGSSNIVQTQSHNHMANLILPVPHCIPQQSGPNKTNMFNLKINNGQLNTDGKNTITVLRESKTANATTHPPPLHPLTKMSLLNVAKNGNNASDSIKITENPDSAVITPIPKSDIECEIPEKRKKTISNILRSSGAKRMKKQNLSKSAQEPNTIDLRFTVNSPESEQEREKKKENDDDITLIKVVPNENLEKRAKINAFLPTDDVKIEIIKTPNQTNTDSTEKSEQNSKLSEESKDKNHGNSNDSNFDATKALDWKDGVGRLPGSDLKFALNEFGLMELVDNDEKKQETKNGNIGDKENVCLSQNSSKSGSGSFANEKKSDDRKTRCASIDTFYCCEGCGCHGLASEFESSTSCSPLCTEMIESRKQQKQKKEKDLNKETRAKRKRKRMQENSAKDSEKSKDLIEKKKESDLKSTDIDDRSKDSDKSDDRVKLETDEDTKESNNMDLDCHEENDSKYPWKIGKLGFSWAKYLEHNKAKAAPNKLFKDTFPYGKNNFKIGMKLEGIDPEHPSQFCVLSVVEVLGHRIRLHFDGYPENYDFWVNADSTDIFPVGWAEKSEHKLNPPKGYVPSNFNWNAYLKTCKAIAAPKTIFSNKNNLIPTSFRPGMKLEAVDKKHSSLVCVATVSDVIDCRLLIHFDSWDDVYDYWADASSPYIHSVGWCEHNGLSLTPPNTFKDPKNFTWDGYLRETNSVAAPARAFKPRAPCGFKRGMKLEAVDKRVPQLIRVATVQSVNNHMIEIHFDGWPENHAYWVEDDSPDIHPIGWCHKTGHPLESPLTPDSLNDRTECGSVGCRGIGHIKGPKYATHNSPSGCPYSTHNLMKGRLIADRLNSKLEFNEFEEDISEKSRMEKITKIEKIEKIKYERSEKSLSFEEKNPETEKDIKQELMEIDRKSDELCRTNNSFETSTPIQYAPNMPDKQLRTELYYSVYNPGYNPLPDAPHIWAKHSNALNRVVSRQTTNPRRWSNEEVIKFIQSVPNCKDIGTVFRQNNIDGEAFLMLTQEDLVSLLGLRLGPALKLYNSIVLLRRRAT